MEQSSPTQMQFMFTIKVSYSNVVGIRSSKVLKGFIANRNSEGRHSRSNG